MTIDEAIERLAIISEERDEDWLDFKYQALKLGIEALKEVKAARSRSRFDPVPYLPGETP